MGQLIFAAPIAGVLAGILGVGVVVLLYMLKLRRRPVPVSSTMLWMRAVRDMEGNVPWQAARPTVLMVMHLLIVLLLACTIARPSIGGGATDQRIVIVVDTSASMNAVIDDQGTTRLAHAKQQATELVRSLTRGSGSPELIVYRVGAEPRLVVGPSRDAKRVMRELNAMMPTDESGELSGVFEQIEMVLASDELIDEATEPLEQARVVVLTDGSGGASVPASVAGAPVDVVVVPQPPMGNVGITALSAQRDRADPQMCRVFVRVQSTESQAFGLVVRVLDGQVELGRTPMAFDGPGVTTATIVVRVAASANLEVVFDRGDALEADNRAWVWVPDPSPVRVAVVADGPAHPILLDVLEAMTGMTPSVVGVDDPIPAWVDLVIGDGVVLDGQLDGQSGLPSISFGPALHDGSQRMEHVVSWKRAHRVLADVSMGSVAFTSLRVLEDESNGATTTLASGRTAPVIIERASSGVRHLEVGFDLDDSNWAIQVGFTIFMANAIEYLVPGASGVGIVTKTSPLHPQVGVAEVQTSQGVRTMGVSVLSADESALIGFDETADVLAVASHGGVDVDVQRPIWRWFLLGAFVVMVLEWFLHAGRLRV